MSVKTVNPMGNLAASSIRGPSQALWANCPVLGMLEDPGVGQYFFDDFNRTGGNTSAAGGVYAGGWGDYNAYIYHGGTITDGQLEGGVISLQSDGDNEGVSIASGTGSFRITTTSTLALNQKLWYEARVACSTITASKSDCFVGLSSGFLSSGLPQAAWPITVTDDTLADTNILGFHRKGTASPTDWSFVYKLTGQTVVYPTNLTTLATSVLGAALTASQYVKLGFLFDPNPTPKQISLASTGQTAGQLKQPLITIFVNGLPAAAFLTNTNVQGTAFPTSFMTPSLAIMNQSGTSPGSLLVDWHRCAQLANS